MPVTVFAYKITRDFGFAPNPYGAACTLATCKPDIRRAGQIGDLIFGCGSVETQQVGRIVFVMRVSGESSFSEFWDNPRFADKRPFFGGSRRRAYGDNIYRRDAQGEWIQARSHHSYPDGSTNLLNLHRDTREDRLLWGDEFAYWGASAIPLPDALADPQDNLALHRVRNTKRNFSPHFVAAAEAWFAQIPQGRHGRPGGWK